jgi:alkanesulfonate monooxygenase SsuD/methylene tetrahydromethanopterin reductase-like flavin-dependent oxidoreductase (luciferase family)
VEIGVGLDQGLGLSWDQHRELAQEATRLGYSSVWTNSGLAKDPFQVCATWTLASAQVAPGGLTSGISVIPVPLWNVPSLAAISASTADMTGGRFVLGVGSGSIYSAAYRRMYGLAEQPPIALMRDWLTVLRGLLNGETVTYAGKTINIEGVKLGLKPPRVPIYVGALGRQMLRLTGKLADGAALNWCNPAAIAWSREWVAEGAREAGRDPSQVVMHEYIRISVDEDEDAARRAYTRALLPYAMARPGANKEHGYRGHFARMGFDEALNELEARRDRGVDEAELVEAFPRELLKTVGYYGRAAGAREHFLSLAEGLDVAIVRVVPSRPGIEAVLDVMRACRPG